MLILKNAYIHSMDGFKGNGDIAINEHLIIEVAQSVTAGGSDTVLDMAGKYITPGLVDAHCHIGMWEDGMGEEGADGNEMTDPVTPHMRAIDGINPFDPCFKEACAHGITSVVTGPGSANVLGGQFAALKTCGHSVEDMLIKAPVAIKAAFGENPKRVYGNQKKAPMTRMATAALLRETLMRAKDYMSKIERAEEADDPSKMPEYNAKLDALIPLMERKIPLKAHAHRSDDILTAIRIAQEFGLEYTLDHCTEGHLITDQLRQSGAGVIVGPLMSDRGKIELRNMTIDLPHQLEAAGIRFAMMTDHPVIPIQYLPVQAALAVRSGLSEDTALRAITVNAAEITGIADRTGSLTPGKDANLVVWSGHPLELMSKAELVLIYGDTVHTLLS